MTDQLRIVIVDDHPMVAEGIQSILESYDDVRGRGHAHRRARGDRPA